MNLAIIILAAGASQRFGESNKLLALVAGRPMIEHVIVATKDVPAAYRFAVTGEADAKLLDLLTRYDVTAIPNPNVRQGQGSSIAAGAQAALHSGAEAALIVLGDMPFVTGKYLRMICETLQDNEAVVSEFAGRHMPPMLFGKAALHRLANLSPEGSGKDVLRSPYKALPLPTDMARDIDTRETLAKYKSSLGDSS
ncbi:NTP transferase domain-containing protein [Litorimonas sp. RW-G-Af-16]|uniref:nucleotidyltransferase family protein n=1 Tax=Litorimonas sp. RW-G-Af-16 TaxID=3241168 RepID=UPI00390C8082